MAWERRPPAVAGAARALPQQHDRANGRLGHDCSTTPNVVADVQSFFAEHPIPQAAKTLEQLLERQRVNADLRDPRGRATDGRTAPSSA